MANLNEKTLAVGVLDILSVDGGIGTVKEIKDGDGTGSSLYIDGTMLGIGLAPTVQLDVYKTGGDAIAKIRSATDDSALYLSAGGAPDNSYIFFDNSDGLEPSEGRIYYDHNDTPATQSMRFLVGDSASTTAMVMMGDGKIGIGTTGPSYTLDIQGSGMQTMRVSSADNHAALRISAGDDGDDSFLYFDNINNDSEGQIYYSHDDDVADQKMFFKVGDAATTAMTIVGDGKIGIGTATPSDPLHIMTSTYDGDVVRIEDDGTGTHHTGADMYFHSIKGAVAIPASGTCTIELESGSYEIFLAGENGFAIRINGYVGSSSMTSVIVTDSATSTATAVGGQKQILVTNTDGSVNRIHGWAITTGGVCKIVAQST